MALTGPFCDWRRSGFGQERCGFKLGKNGDANCLTARKPFYLITVAALPRQTPHRGKLSPFPPPTRPSRVSYFIFDENHLLFSLLLLLLLYSSSLNRHLKQPLFPGISSLSFTPLHSPHLACFKSRGHGASLSATCGTTGQLQTFLVRFLVVLFFNHL